MFNFRKKFELKTDRILPEQEKFASWPRKGKILEFYKGQFDSVYIMLHPFILPISIKIERFCPQDYPTKREIIEGCEPVSWHRILELTHLRTISEIEIGLQTRIFGFDCKYANANFAYRLDELFEKEHIVCPSGTNLPPLIENRIYKAVKPLDYQSLWIGDPYTTDRKLYEIDELIEKNVIPSYGCVFTDDHCLLVTTPWDSDYSFLCSSRKIIEQILSFDNLEGFYCTEQTDVYWGLCER
jgi:hypothetical protein